MKKMVKDGLIEVGDYNGKRHKYVSLTKKGEEFPQKTVDLVLVEEIAAFGGSMISCIYGLMDVAVVGQYQGPQGAAAGEPCGPWAICFIRRRVHQRVNYMFLLQCENK